MLGDQLSPHLLARELVRQRLAETTLVLPKEGQASELHERYGDTLDFASHLD